MSVVLEILEYKITGWWAFFFFCFFGFWALACLGVVGEKQAKKRQAEIERIKEENAKEEYRKAQELIEKQAQAHGVNTILDPEAHKKANESIYSSGGSDASKNADAKTDTTNEVTSSTPEVIIFDAPASNTNETTDINSSVQNVSAENQAENGQTNASEEVPAILVINEDGTSGTI